MKCPERQTVTIRQYKSFFFLFLLSAMSIPAQWVELKGPGNYSISEMNAVGSKIFIKAGLEAYFTNDFGASWSPSVGFPPYYVKSMASMDGYFFALTEIMGMYRSSDSGATWHLISRGLPGNRHSNSLIVKGPYLFAGTADGVRRSSDNGTTWTSMTDGFPDIRAVEGFAVNGPFVFAGSSGNGIFRTPDYGASWTPVNVGLPANFEAACFAVSGENTFVGAYSKGVFRSSDSGLSWKPVSRGLPANSSILSLAVFGDRIFTIADSGGLYRLSANDSSWVQINTNLKSSVTVYAVVISGDYLFLRTELGLFRNLVSELSVAIRLGHARDSMSDAKLLVESLVRPGSNVGFHLSHRSKVNLGIFNLNGIKVSTLVDNVFHQGSVLVSISGNEMASGTYQLLLEAGGRRYTRRFIFSR